MCVLNSMMKAQVLGDTHTPRSEATGTDESFSPSSWAPAHAWGVQLILALPTWHPTSLPPASPGDLKLQDRSIFLIEGLDTNFRDLNMLRSEFITLPIPREAYQSLLSNLVEHSQRIVITNAFLSIRWHFHWSWKPPWHWSSQQVLSQYCAEHNFHKGRL